MNVWDVIVLGQIPGTQIQLDFTAWLFAMAVVAVSLAASNALRTALRGNVAQVEALPAIEDLPATKSMQQLTAVTRLLLNVRIRRALAS